MKLDTCKQKLLESIGKPYTTKVIDRENCVYLDLGDYDIEVSSTRREFIIYVWQKKGGFRVIETHSSLKRDIEKTKGILKGIEEKYINKLLQIEGF